MLLIAVFLRKLFFEHYIKLKFIHYLDKNNVFAICCLLFHTP